MMAKWTTTKFITSFFNNTLNRKKVHGTYRVLEGDYCKLLVRATVEFGIPSGNELIAIDISDSENRMVFWKKGYSRNFSYNVTRDIEEGMGPYQTLPDMILTGEEENILNSGIIDISPAYALIEIGDKPFLLHRTITGGDAQTVTLGKGYSHANQVPRRVSSILKAQATVKEPVDERKLCKEWWAKEMPQGFVPPVFDPEAVKILSTALNPIDFGFAIAECTVNGGPSIRYFIPKKKVLETVPTAAKVHRWNGALAQWTDAASALWKRQPVEYKGLSVQSSRYSSMSNDEDRTGTIIVTTEGVYITGKVHNKINWNEAVTLTTWYKLTQPANQINIPSCT